jgi:hypothetical protein
MSLSKPVPGGFRERECETTILCKCPSVPYIPEEDPVQETVSALKKAHLKTTIGEDTTLQLSVWHTGTRKSLLMHVNATLDAIKKPGHLEDHKEAQEIYVQQKELAKQAKTATSELVGVTSEGVEKSKKSSKKAKKAESTADVPDPNMRAMYLQDLKKAKEASEKAKCNMTTTSNKMFQYYANLLSSEAKYAWNKTLTDQTWSDTYVDLQGNSQKGPRGATCQSYEECVMFHLLTVFPINTAEQHRVLHHECT